MAESFVEIPLPLRFVVSAVNTSDGRSEGRTRSNQLDYAGFPGIRRAEDKGCYGHKSVAACEAQKDVLAIESIKVGTDERT